MRVEVDGSFGYEAATGERLRRGGRPEGAENLTKSAGDE
jgi:hypothetical protein